MTNKFNVGDKVEIMNVDGIDYGSKHYYNGMITKVVRVIGDDVFLLNNDGEEGVYIARGEYDCIKLIEPKPTKNQRITALEETVAKQGEEIEELKLIVAQIRKPSTVVEEALSAATVDDNTIEFEGKTYKKVDREAREGDVVVLKFTDSESNAFKKGIPYKVHERMTIQSDHPDHEGNLYNVYSKMTNRTTENVDVYELIVEDKSIGETARLIEQAEKLFKKSPNQQRAEIIEKAKGFVDENSGDDYHFEIDEEKRTILAWKIYRVGRVYKANCKLATCSSNDVFNENIGKAIALGRALGLDVSEFEQAVQPDEVVVGHDILISNDAAIYKRTVRSFEKNIVNYTGKGSWDFKNDVIGFSEILNDTNAIYETAVTK